MAQASQKAASSLTREGEVVPVLATGGLLGALLGSSCCVLPLALAGLGLGGARLGYLSVLAPAQPIFLVAAIGFIAAAHLQAHRRRLACTRDMARAAPQRGRSALLWASTGLAAASLAADLATRFL